MTAPHPALTPRPPLPPPYSPSLGEGEKSVWFPSPSPGEGGRSGGRGGQGVRAGEGESLIQASRLLGGKASNLAVLESQNLPVPPWYALTTTAFRRALTTAGLPERIAARLGRGDDL